MKNKLYYFLIFISLNALVGCGGAKKEKVVKLDLLLCESPDNNRLTGEQVKMLIPFEKDSSRYLLQGSILNTKYAISYVKEKNWIENLGNVQKPFFSEQTLAEDHLKGLNLSSLSLTNPLSADDVSKHIAGYDLVFGFSTKQSKDIPAYISRRFAKSEDVTSYITDSMLVNNPDAKILVIYNPPAVVPVKIDSVTLAPAALSLIKGGSKTLDFKALPENAANKSVSWKSSNELVAKVEEGKVTAVAEGTATITVKTVDGGKTADCKVTVKEKTVLPPEPVKPVMPPKQEYTVAELNDMLSSIAKGDDAARDKMSKLKKVDVYGADNISNVQELINDVSIGTRYTVTDVQTGGKGKVISITVKK